MKTKRKPAKRTLPAPAVKVGAASALERLEAEEASLFTAYEAAKTGGDALEIKIARDAWLKCSESLRKFDLLIEAARRETGELVPRAHVEALLENVGVLLHWSLCKVTDMRGAWEITDNSYQVLIAGYDPRISAPVQECPGWMYKALFKHGEWRRPKDFDQQLAAIHIIAEGIAHHRGDEARFFSFLKSNLPAPTPKESTP